MATQRSINDHQVLLPSNASNPLSKHSSPDSSSSFSTKPSSLTQTRAKQSKDDETNYLPTNGAAGFVSVKNLCYALIAIALFVFYEDLLVARMAVRKHFFGRESAASMMMMFGGSENGGANDLLVDEKTGRLDLNERRIAQRRKERLETLEEHNEKELIDRVGIEKAEEIIEEEEEEKEGFAIAIQIKEAEERKVMEEELEKKKREDEVVRKLQYEEVLRKAEEQKNKREQEKEKEELLRRDFEDEMRTKEDARLVEEMQNKIREANSNNNNVDEPPEKYKDNTNEGSYVRATSTYGLRWAPPAPTAPPTPEISKVVEEAIEIGDSTAISLEDQAPNFDIFTGGALPLLDPEDTLQEHEWRSIGQVTPINGMDLDFPGNLKIAAERRSFRKEIILFVTNRGGNHLAANTVANLRKLGFEHYILITNTAETCYDLLKGPWGVDCGWTSFLKTRAKQMGTFQVSAEEQATPFRLWWVRFHYMERLVGMGYNPMYVDTDVRFEMNPYPLLKSPPFNKFTLFAQDENGHAGGLNIGCVYAQNAPEFGVTRWVLNETVSRMLRIIDSEPPLKNWRGQIAAGAKETLWDQHIFNDVVETAVSGKPVFRRSMQRLIDPGNGNKMRDDWVEKQNYDSSRWDLSMEKINEKVLPPGLKEVDVRPMKIGDEYEIKSRKLVGLKNFPPTTRTKEEEKEKEEIVCGFPPWMVSGWSGIAGPMQVQGQPGYWTSKPTRIVMGHAVGALRKTTTFKGLGWWNYGAEAYKPYHLQKVEEKLGSKGVLGFIGLKTTVSNAKAGVEQHGLSVARVVEIATASGRRPISPTVPCDAPWIEKVQGAAQNNIMMRHQIVVSTLCGKNRNELCCQSLNFDCDEGVMLEVKFWNDPRYQRFRDDITVIDAKKLLSNANDEKFDLSTIEQQIDSIAGKTKTVFIDISHLSDTSFVPSHFNEQVNFVQERDEIFRTCDRLDCRPPNKPYPSEHEPCRKVAS